MGKSLAFNSQQSVLSINLNYAQKSNVDTQFYYKYSKDYEYVNRKYLINFDNLDPVERVI